jgi:hypothetical protein
MEKKEPAGLHGDQKARGVWERSTGDRRWGQNQLFGSFRVDPGVQPLSSDDPTDNALAAIASILEKPADKPTDEAVHQSADQPQGPDLEVPTAAAEPPEPGDVDADGYVKFGPGPLDAIRFKWMARSAGDGKYFVDETIGDSSRTRTSGPMPKLEAIKFIDDRERDARQRFDALRSEMTGQSSSNSDRKDSGEI